MDPLHALAAFGTIFPAELPDKTMLASMVLATRFRGGLVWIGVAGAFGAHVVIAVVVGGLLSRLPDTAVALGAALIFAVGAVLLWRSASEDEAADSAEGELLSARASADSTGPWSTVATSFGVVFVAEWGDLTQLTTANLSARFGDPVMVGIGALLALWSVAAIGVTVGHRLLTRLPVALVRRVAAVVFALVAIVGLSEAVR